MEYMGRFLFWRGNMARRINPKIKERPGLPYKLYYFVCEDAESMQYYLEGLKKQYNGRNIVIKTEKAHKGNDAKSVHASAVNKRNEISKRKRMYPNGYVVICCFDKDNNDIVDIKRIISKNEKYTDMATIYNSPCYEYWLLLHAKNTSRVFTSSNQCCHETMKTINGCYNQKFEDLDKFKNAKNIFDIVGQDLPKAITNAKSIHFSSEDLDKTYTNAHVVLEEIIKMAE